MFTRTRTRGSALPATKQVAISSATRSVSMTMSCSPWRAPSVPTFVSVTVKNYWMSDPSFKATVNVPSSCFNWVNVPGYGFDCRTVNSSFAGKLLELLRPYLANVKYAESMLGALSLSERVTSFNYDCMTDVTGSGFNKRRKTEFVVNPCDSIRNGFFLTESVPSSSKPQLSIINLSFSAGSGDFSLRAQAVPEIPFTTAAFNAFREAWLPTRDPSDFSGLYSNAAAKVSEADFETLAAIAELKETVTYLYHRLSTVGSIIKSIQRRDFRFIKNWENLSKKDLWLESRYAIRPLFYDVQSILTALRNNGKLKQTLSKYDSRSDSTESFKHFTFSSDGCMYEAFGTHASSYYARGGAYARLALDLEFAYKYGLLNLASASWEAVPYSFIVDWFFSVSSFIAGLNPNPIYSIEAGYVSVKSEDFFFGTISGSMDGNTKEFGFSDSVQRHSRIPYDNRFTVNVDINLNFHKFVDLCLIFGRR